MINPSAQQQQLINVHGGKRLQVHAKSTSTMIYTRPLWASICNKPLMGSGECFSAGKKKSYTHLQKLEILKDQVVMEHILLCGLQIWLPSKKQRMMIWNELAVWMPPMEEEAQDTTPKCTMCMPDSADEVQAVFFPMCPCHPYWMLWFHSCNNTQFVNVHFFSI